MKKSEREGAGRVSSPSTDEEKFLEFCRKNNVHHNIYCKPSFFAGLAEGRAEAHDIFNSIDKALNINNKEWQSKVKQLREKIKYDIDWSDHLSGERDTLGLKIALEEIDKVFGKEDEQG